MNAMGKKMSAEPALLAGGNPQIAKGEGDAPVQAYIAAMPGWKSDVGRRLDALITRTVPGVHKAVKWNSPFYGVQGQGWFLSFHCFTKYVKVAFFRGTSLRPVPPVESKSNDTRYVHIQENGQVDEAQLAAWIKQASELPGEKCERHTNHEESGTEMKKATTGDSKTSESGSASAQIDLKIRELNDWRGETLAHIRALIKQAVPDVVEELKWRGVPVWSHGGIICTGETYKSTVKMTFAKGAKLEDPAGLFNSSLEGNTRRAIDVHEGDKIDEKALKALVRAAAALNSAPARRE